MYEQLFSYGDDPLCFTAIEFTRFSCPKETPDPCDLVCVC